MANPVAEALTPFFWGRGGARMTPEQIAREREIAEALGGVDTSPVGHWLEGAARMANAATGRIREGRANRAADENATFNRDTVAGLLGGFGGGSNPGLSSAMATMPAPDYASARVAQAHNAGSPLPSSFLSAVDSTEGAGGYDTLFGHAQRGPFAGTDVSQMTIGDALAFASPSGAYGQHVKGQIGRVATPMGRHQIVGTTLRNAVQEMGLDPSMPFDQNTQDAVAAHLARRRIAGAGTMDGKIAGLRSEWEGFKNVPRAQMEQIVRDLEAAPSAQPNAGGLTPEQLQAWGANTYAPMQDAGALGAVNALGAAQPVPVAENEADILAQEQAMAAQDPMTFTPAPPMGAPREIADSPVLAALTNANVNPDVPMAGGATGFAPIGTQAPNIALPAGAGFSLPQAQMQQPQMAQAGGINPAIIEALSSPYADEGTRRIAGLLLGQHLEQQQQANDPVRALQLERAQLENAALRNPTPKDTDDIREYNYAREQGYQGSFTDFMTDMRRAGATNVNVGGDGAPGLGKLSPDYGYVLDPETRQPVIDPATGLPRSAPIPGSPAAIAAEQAAAEQERLAGAQTRSDADKAETTLDATQSVLDIMQGAETPATGTLSRPFSLYSGTPAGKVRSYVKTLQSGVALGAMQRLKEMSATGATGFGSLSAPELDLLINDIGALDPDNTEPEIFTKTVERIRDRSRRVAQDIAKNVSPERIQELGLQPFIDAFKASEAKGNRTKSGVQWSIE